MNRVQNYATQIRLENKNEKTPFARWNINRISKQSFSDDPKFRINSKEISIKDYQNENATDCRIYDTLAKYNGDLTLTQAQLNQNYQAISDDLAQINSLPEAMSKIQAGEQAWKQLPLEIRKEFGNNIKTFMKNGQKWANDKITAYNKLIAEQEAALSKPIVNATTEIKIEK